MKPSSSPTHEAITCRAREIWNVRGNPNGLDTAIWLEAERQLTETSGESAGVGSDKSHASPARLVQQIAAATGGEVSPEAKPTPHHSSESSTATPDPIEIVAKAAAQKKSARAPRLPTHHNAPKVAPTESGKPLWNQPHSS